MVSAVPPDATMRALGEFYGTLEERLRHRAPESHRTTYAPTAAS